LLRDAAADRHLHQKRPRNVRNAYLLPYTKPRASSPELHWTPTTGTSSCGCRKERLALSRVYSIRQEEHPAAWAR